MVAARNDCQAMDHSQPYKRPKPGWTLAIIMRPSSLGGGRILRRTLSVCPSVRPVIVATGYVFSAPLASRRAT